MPGPRAMSMHASKEGFKLLHYGVGPYNAEEYPDIEALESEVSTLSDESEDELPTEAEPLPQALYGYAIASLIDDSSKFFVVKSGACLRCCRTLLAILLVYGMFALQTFFVVEMKLLVTPAEVKKAKIAYGKYEMVMYTDFQTGVQNWYINSFGYARGTDGFIILSNWKLTENDRVNGTTIRGLSGKEKDTICDIPLSRLEFLSAVLLIWTLTILRHARRAVNLGVRFAWVPTVSSGCEQIQVNENGRRTVVGLTICLKIFLTLFVSVPRLCLIIYLWWMGSRWLTATMGWAAVLLNALALEFILCLDELIYFVLVPFHGRKETQTLFVPHLFRTEKRTFLTMFSLFAVLCVAVLMVVFYIVFQSVLPGYKYDVRQVCQAHLEHEMVLTGGGQEM